MNDQVTSSDETTTEESPLVDQDTDKDAWILELETALLSDCDINVIRKMSSQQSIPNNLRYEFWQVCLGIKGRVKILEDIFDLPEQNLIRNDCRKLVEKLNNSSSEKLSILSDLESIITNFSRLNHCPYTSKNGWIDLLETLIHLNVKRDELFKVFESIELRYITKYYNCSNDDSKESKSMYMQPFHLLRLFLLYHDPELCNYFDTIKLTTEQFASTWFQSLFCFDICNPNVSLNLLDAYFTYSDSFMIFYLSLVMIINLKDDLKMKNDRTEIINILSTIPSSITESDIKDMFFIAEQHFLQKTPLSVKDFQKLLFQVHSQTDIYDDLCHIEDLSTLLCLPISIHELLNSCQNENNLRYFVVDCRPPDQYNNGHLLTAFHLDCSLMLNDPSVFATAVQALLASQKQAIEANAIAGGEHLCFIGSGRDDTDDYIHMVISSFLQKHHKYVSYLYGGFEVLHKTIMEKHLDHLLVDHNSKHCLCCVARKSFRSIQNDHSSSSSDSRFPKDVDHLTSVFFQKFSTAVKPKISEMKEKLVEYVVNPNQKQVIKHVSSENLGKRYKGSKFSLDDSNTDLDEDTSDINAENDLSEINIEEWKKQQNLIGCFECSKINSDNSRIPGYLAVTKTNLYFFKHSKNREGYGQIIVQRPLEMIYQITSKRKCPEIITFKYGHSNNDGNESVLIAKDSLILVEPFEVIRLIKQQVINLLDQNHLNYNQKDSSKK
ncbi:TBC1 domain family member 23 [Dermatophagoides pteronyssinus]|uniref:TBC1 domain family member 23 n=1 Tax=Dermatophagoides pteronyssinus TaxID=6956 RepID=UPI003F66E163